MLQPANFIIRLMGHNYLDTRLFSPNKSNETNSSITKSCLHNNDLMIKVHR